MFSPYKINFFHFHAILYTMLVLIREGVANGDFDIPKYVCRNIKCLCELTQMYRKCTFTTPWAPRRRLSHHHMHIYITYTAISWHTQTHPCLRASTNSADGRRGVSVRCIETRRRLYTQAHQPCHKRRRRVLAGYIKLFKTEISLRWNLA